MIITNRIKEPDENRVGLVQHDARITSIEAAELIMPNSGTCRLMVLEALNEHPFGMTYREIQEYLDWEYSSVGPRVRELRDGGWAITTTEKRGRQLIHKITPAGREKLR